MGKNSSDNYSQLIDRLKDPSEEKRLQAIRQIRQICDLEFYDYLVAIFKNDESPDVRAEAAETLVWLAFNNLSDDIIQDLKEAFTIQETKTSSRLQATLLSSVIALKNLENIRRLINVQDNLTAETKNDEEKIKSLQEKILKETEEKNSFASQVKKLTEDLNSFKTSYQEKEQETAKLVMEVDNLKEKSKKEKRKFFYLKIVAGILLLVSIGEGLLLLVTQRKIRNIQKDNLQKIKGYETKINEYQMLVYTYEAKLKDPGMQKSQMEENIRKIQEIEEMKKEINRLAGDALVAAEETRKFFMKCHDAFFNIDIQNAGVEIAYKKKKGFLEAARLAMTGKLSQSQRIYIQTLKLK